MLYDITVLNDEGDTLIARPKGYKQKPNTTCHHIFIDPIQASKTKKAVMTKLQPHLFFIERDTSSRVESRIWYCGRRAKRSDSNITAIRDVTPYPRVMGLYGYLLQRAELGAPLGIPTLAPAVESGLKFAVNPLDSPFMLPPVLGTALVCACVGAGVGVGLSMPAFLAGLALVGTVIASAASFGLAGVVIGLVMGIVGAAVGLGVYNAHKTEGTPAAGFGTNIHLLFAPKGGPTEQGSGSEVVPLMGGKED